MQGRGVEIAQTLIDRRLVKRGNRRAGRQRHVQPAGEITNQPGVLQHMAQIEAWLIVTRQGGTADATDQRRTVVGDTAGGGTVGLVGRGADAGAQGRAGW